MDQLSRGRWVVYFSERGSRESERFLDDEVDACAPSYSAA
jgi:hypothetical protein